MSLAPSSTMTASISGPRTLPIRASPPALVSPGTPALIDGHVRRPVGVEPRLELRREALIGGRPEPAVSELPKARMRISAVAAPASARTKARAGTEPAQGARCRPWHAAEQADFMPPTLRGNAEAVNIPRAAGGGR